MMVRISLQNPCILQSVNMYSATLNDWYWLLVAADTVLVARTKRERERRQERAVQQAHTDTLSGWGTCVSLTFLLVLIGAGIGYVYLAAAAKDDEDGSSSEVNDSDGIKTGWIIVGSILACCCCCCCCYYSIQTIVADDDGPCDDCICTHWCCDGDAIISRLPHVSLRPSKRQHCVLMRYVMLLHVVTIPADLLLELPALVCTAMLTLTLWRAGSLRSGDGGANPLCISGWECNRVRRYQMVGYQALQWLLDVPALPALGVLLLTGIRARPTLDELSFWRHPTRVGVARERSKRVQEYEAISSALQKVTQDDTSTVPHTKFPLDTHVGLFKAERRLAVAKMLHGRLAADSWTVELPMEAVVAIAAFVEPVLRVPSLNWPSLAAALKAAAPDTTILLQPGVHRLTIEHLRATMTVAGLGATPKDCVLVPFAPSKPTVSPATASCLKNLTLLHTPTPRLVGPGGRAVLASLAHPNIDAETAKRYADCEWRTLVWKQAMLLVLDLPFPVMAMLCLWRGPGLWHALQREHAWHDQGIRTRLTCQHLLLALLDVVCLPPLLLLLFTGWRIPSLVRAHRHLRPGQSSHRQFAMEFKQWLLDLPYMPSALIVMPCIWRSPWLLWYLCTVGVATPPDRLDVWHQQIAPWQRRLVLRHSCLCILDLMVLAASPLLLLTPWRLRQLCAFQRYERLVAAGAWLGAPPGVAAAPLELQQMFKLRAQRPRMARLEHERSALLISQLEVTITGEANAAQRKMNPERSHSLPVSLSVHISHCDSVLFASVSVLSLAVADIVQLVVVVPFALVIGCRHIKQFCVDCRSIIAEFHAPAVRAPPNAHSLEHFTNGVNCLAPRTAMLTEQVAYSGRYTAMVSCAITDNGSLWPVPQQAGILAYWSLCEVPVRRKFHCSGGQTRNPLRAPVSAFKTAQANTLAHFRERARTGAWQAIHRDHFDWWMFPIEDSSQARFNVFAQDVQELMADAEWSANYLAGVEILARAWGWNLAGAEPIPEAECDEGQTWTDWDVRLAKIIRSLWLFDCGEEMQSMQMFARHVKPQGGLRYGTINLDEVLYMTVGPGLPVDAPIDTANSSVAGPARVLLSFQPRLPFTAFWWPLWRWWLSAIHDVPHILLLPIKFLAVLLCPAYLYMCVVVGQFW
jgi:hypothetical protein